MWSFPPHYMQRSLSEVQPIFNANQSLSQSNSQNMTQCQPVREADSTQLPTKQIHKASPDGDQCRPNCEIVPAITLTARPTSSRILMHLLCLHSCVHDVIFKQALIYSTLSAIHIYAYAYQGLFEGTSVTWSEPAVHFYRISKSDAHDFGHQGSLAALYDPAR